jgi:hypothetical protein
MDEVNDSLEAIQTFDINETSVELLVRLIRLLELMMMRGLVLLLRIGWRGIGMLCRIHAGGLRGSGLDGG